MTPLLIRDFGTYAARCLKVKASEGGRLLPFRLNATQQILIDAIEKDTLEGRPARHVVLKSRRPGISTGVAGLFFHDVATRRYRRAIVLAHTGDSAKKIFSIYERFHKNMPTINGVLMQPTRSGARGKEMYFPHLDSGLSVGTGMAEDFGRGDEAQDVHLSEMASFVDPENTLQALMPIVPNTVGSCVVMETTSKGGGTWFCDFWKATSYGETGWTKHFFPWTANPTYVMTPDIDLDDLTDMEKVYMQEFGMSLAQIAWRRFVLRTQFMGNEQRFRLEYPLTEEDCWVMVGDVIWDYDMIEPLYVKQEPLFVGNITRDGLVADIGGPLTIWEFPQEGSMYCCGADPAGGVADGDASVASVWKVQRTPSLSNRESWPVQVAEWAGESGPVPFAQVLNTLGLYYKKALLSVEVTGLGRSCNDTLMRVFHYPLLHRWMPWDRYGAKSKTFGWETTPRSKSVLLGIMDWLVRTRRLTVHSPDLFQEWLGMRKTGECAYEGAISDDRIMAAWIGLVSWFQHRYQATPLSDLQKVLVKTYGGEPADGSELVGTTLPLHEPDYEWHKRRNRQRQDEPAGDW